MMEYELIDIEFDPGYEVPEQEGFFVHDDEPEAQSSPQIEYDADGVPMGNSVEEIKLRRQMIYQFYEAWKNSHPEKAVYNKCIKALILIRSESVIEAAEHSAKSYRSTVAVMQLDELLTNAEVGEDKPKIGDKNQAKLTRMILMYYCSQELGRIKLTVGVRRRSGDKIQYCITALEDGEKIKPVNKKTKNKAPHRK